MQIENGKIVEICVVAAVGAEAGAAEEVEDLMMISTAAVATMAVKIATMAIEVEAVDMMMMLVREEGVLAATTTGTMVTAADMADPQVEAMEMDLPVQVDHRGMVYLLPHLYPVVVLRYVHFAFFGG